METTDKNLIEQFLAGNRKAFEGLVLRWERPVLNLAFRLTGDLDAARDIRQNTLIKAYRGLASFNGDARFSTWLYRIVVNLCRDRARAERVRHDALQKISPGEEAEGPDEGLKREETARLVARAVSELPEQEREVVVLKHYHERSFREIAVILGAPPSTLKSRMERALEKLRTRLKDLDG